jgi:dynamin 1-like protein
VQEDYINTSHPSFIGGSKAVEEAQQQVRSAKTSAVVVRKVCMVMSTVITDFLW